LVKRILLTALQFLAYLGLLMLGGYWDIVRLLLEMRAPAFNVIPLLKFHVTAAHDLIANGIVFALVLLLVLLIIQAARRLLRVWAPLSVLAFALALALSLYLKMGLPPAS